MATESELSRDADAALEAVDARMIEAEKDRRFVEAVREIFDKNTTEYGLGSKMWQLFVSSDIRDAHRDIYGTPCTASAKTEGK